MTGKGLTTETVQQCIKVKSAPGNIMYKRKFVVYHTVNTER